LASPRSCAGSDGFVESATNHARVGFFGVAKGARVVHLVTSEAEVGGGGRSIDQTSRLRTFAYGCDLAARLRRIVLVGEAVLGAIVAVAVS
jgi:hypothetical protein